MHTPLYIKTHNSLLQSLIRIDDLISFAKENGFKALTITDNNMYGVIEFYDKCVKNDIKPIIGLEIDDVIVYAINYQGYKNLLKLSTIMSKRIVTNDDLALYSENLLCITLYKSRHKYQELSKYFNYIFQGYSNLDQKHDLKGNLVYVNEILYLDKKDEPYLKYLYAIKDGISLDEVNLDKSDNHILAYQLYDNENNDVITDLCNVTLEFNQDLLPIYECPNDLDSYTYLKQLIKDGLKKHFGNSVPKKYVERLKYELDIINRMGFCNYFLVVWDYVNFAKDNDILIGPGRGSAASSLVSFCLGITSIDPLKYNLLFERFLNPDRISMPDIDIDFQYDRRDEVVKYCINKYGLKKAAPIITFGTLGSKQAIRDVSRAMKIDLKQVDLICKLIDSRISLKDNLNNDRLKGLLDNNLKTMYKVAMRLEGLKRHTSIHAAGIVISCVELDEVIPLSYHDGFYTTGYSMEYLESLGLLKMDILALKNLTLLNDILKEVNLDLESIPLNDAKAIKIFTDVDTIGIFQFESDGMMNFLRKFRPNCFEDVIAAIALFRPGPMNNIDSYIRRKNGQEKIDYIDSKLVDILKPTYGIIVYQEQIMQIANVLANYTLSEADLLRKAMSKKQENILIKEKEKFISQSIANGIKENTAIKVYDLILKFASYGFNRAHSVAYSMIAYKMAYLKAYYPLVFIKHLLNNVIGSEIKTKEYIQTAKTKNLNIERPDINKSKLTYVIDDNKLYFPFTNIKNIGENIAKEIVLNQPYKDIFDFLNKTKINKSTFETLIKANCFASLNLNQRTLDENLDALINYNELGALLSEEELKPVINYYDEYDDNVLMKRELESFGFYLANHPLSKYRSDYPIRANDISKYFDKIINIVVVVDKTKMIVTKKNEKMLFITGSDEESVVDIVLFPKNYQDDIERGSVYLINGKVEKRFDKFQIIVNNLKKL